MNRVSLVRLRIIPIGRKRRQIREWHPEALAIECCSLVFGKPPFRIKRAA